MIHEHLQLWLYAAEETSYERLELPQRRLSCWAISYVRRGRVFVRSPEGEHVADAGKVMVHPPNQPFSERANVRGAHQWLLLDARDGSRLELLRRHPLPRVLHLTDPETFERGFAVLKRAWDEDASLREMRVMSGVLELLTILFNDAENVPRNALLSEPADRFERAIYTMRNHLHEPLSRRDLAQKAHLHPAHFDRAFREIYGLTPMQMLRELRLSQAKQLLETTDGTLAEVAEACGFHDAAYLSRTFKARFQETPGSYRERVKNTKRGYLFPLIEDVSALDNDSRATLRKGFI